MSNKNGMIIRVVCTLIVILWGALTTVILFMGNTVKANDNKATVEHTAIRKEFKQDDDKVRKELMLKIEAVQMEQKIMRKETSLGFTKVLVAIAEIKK